MLIEFVIHIKGDNSVGINSRVLEGIQMESDNISQEFINRCKEELKKLYENSETVIVYTKDEWDDFKKFMEDQAEENYRELLLNELSSKFGKNFWAKNGGEWGGKENPLIWSGECSMMPDGLPAFDYDSTDYKELLYVMGVHKELHDWADSHDCFWDCYDPGTYMLFRK